MYTEFIDRNILYMNLLRAWHKFPLSMIIGLNYQGDHVKSSKNLWIFKDMYNEESEKRFIEKNDFFFHDLSIMK